MKPKGIFAVCMLAALASLAGAAQTKARPQIMGISLKDDNSQRQQSATSTADSNADSTAGPRVASNPEANSASILSLVPGDLTRLCLIGMH